MKEKDFLKKTKDLMFQEFEKEGSGHDFWHLQRVVANAKKIHLQEGGDWFLIELSSWLHDFGDYKLNDGKDHSEHKIKNTLKALGLDELRIQTIIDVVKQCSYKGGFNVPPTSLEAKIVQDADRLDAIGAIGIARTFAYGGKKGNVLYNPTQKPVAHDSFESYKSKSTHTINHFYEKLLKLKDLMQTKTGKKMAEERHDFMLHYLEEFYNELG